MLRIKQIVNKIFTSNTYVISEGISNIYWLIDVGDFDKVIDILPNNANIKGVFLTHSHFDHIYGMNELYERFPKCIVYTSTYGAKAMCSEKMNFSFYHENPVIFKGKNIKVLKEKDTIELFEGCWMRVFETPGHCPSCLTYILDNYIFTGDSYIPDVAVVSKLPKGNKELASNSRERIIQLAKGLVICAGHGPIVTENRK